MFKKKKKKKKKKIFYNNYFKKVLSMNSINNLTPLKPMTEDFTDTYYEESFENLTINSESKTLQQDFLDTDFINLKMQPRLFSFSQNYN